VFQNESRVRPISILPYAYLPEHYKIEISPSSLSEYTKILNDQMKTAIAMEEGVLKYREVNEKENPHLFTLIEIYRDYDSYLSHIKTTHFLNYKSKVENKVKSLVLLDANLIGKTSKKNW
jgi:quinol monooxygenase YgiN